MIEGLLIEGLLIEGLFLIRGPLSTRRLVLVGRLLLLRHGIGREGDGGRSGEQRPTMQRHADRPIFSRPPTMPQDPANAGPPSTLAFLE
ncbi:hypothetical protein VQ03_29035 [Methylobacterium tarhaniae]|uniref:Uncharacterized protein n=1 Tax=Methylobacterium tarhaniae TaxID=1187852 RepID=A0A0J6S7Z8_9HYPH|nr:hypothetical protein VQ03_29035 [Methylobacterium tarhaniae]